MTQNNPSLYSTIVRLMAARSGSLPATQGRLAHAAFFDILRSVDPALAENLHAQNRRKPFTVSPLQGGRFRRGRIHVEAGQQMWLRFTLLSDELFTTFIHHFLLPDQRTGPGHLPTLRLGGLDFTVTEMLTTPGSHPWAGYTDLAQLLQRWQNTPPDKAAHTIALEFASPTVFSRGSQNGLGKMMEPFPHPAMLFGSLAAMWNDHLPEPMALDKQAIRTSAEETVVVGLYKMESKMFRYWGSPQIGAIGQVTYLLRDRQNHLLTHTLNLLADFAFYSGIGYKTTMGMGQVRRNSRG